MDGELARWGEEGLALALIDGSRGDDELAERPEEMEEESILVFVGAVFDRWWKADERPRVPIAAGGNGEISNDDYDSRFCE